MPVIKFFDWIEKLNNPELIIKKTLAYVSLAYGVGLLLLNASFALLWGFSDFNIFNVQCVLATVEVTVFAGCAVLPLLIVRMLGDLFTRYTKRWKCRKLIRNICLCLLGSIIVGTTILAWFPRASIVQAFAARHASQMTRYRLQLFYGLLYVVGVVASGPLYGLWIDRKERKVQWHEFVFSISIGMLVIPFCLMGYLSIPVRWGGAAPEPRELWVSSIALPILAPCSREAEAQMDMAQKRGSGHDNDLFPVEGLYLLHEKASSLILWSNECPVIMEISKDLVKGSQWVDPQRKAAARP